jgi:hypothetical protein
MKPYRILKTFKGSQTGLDGPYLFTEGTVAELSDHLAQVMLRAGYVKPAVSKEVARQIAEVAAPVVGLKEPVPEGNLEEAIANPTEIRETKVTGPEETKPLSEMSFKELKDLAKERGVKVPIGTTQAALAEMLAA